MGYYLSIIPGSNEGAVRGDICLNLFRMEILMRSLTNVVDWKAQHQPFPRPRPTAEADWDDDGRPLTDAAQAFVAAHERVLRASSPIPGRVPWFKFVTNDGWVVSAAEAKILLDEARVVRADDMHPCRAALIRDMGAAADSAWMATLDDFIDFVDVAAAEGGFRVY